MTKNLSWKECDKCKRKFKHLTSYKGLCYCKVCYNNLGEKMPYVPLKLLKCLSCGREQSVAYNVIMSVCPSCQVIMKEVDRR